MKEYKKQKHGIDSTHLACHRQNRVNPGGEEGKTGERGSNKVTNQKIVRKHYKATLGITPAPG